MATKPKQIDRRIYFFRIDAGNGSDGVSLPLDLGNLVSSVGELPFTSASKRYWQQRGGDDIALWADTSPDRFSFAAVRRGSLPQSEFQGTLTQLKIGAEAGLYEPSHVRIYPDNLLGVEFNFYGPRVTRLPKYLKHVLGDEAPDMALEALLRKDSAERLARYSELRVLDLQLRPSYISKVREASASLGDAFAAMERVSDAEILGLTLRPEPRKRSSLGRSVLNSVSKLSRRSDLHQNVSRFSAKGLDEHDQVKTIDLLDDHLATRTKVMALGQRSRAVEPQAAFDAIDQAYDELKSDLMLADGLSLTRSDA